MQIIVLNHEEIETLLPMEACIDVMADALETLAKNEAHNPLRSVVRPPNEGHFLGLMPAYRGGDRPAYVLKEVCIFPDNPTRNLDAHQGAVLLHSATTGELMSVMNASAITAIRTAAVSGLATRLLARKNATTAAIIGTGVQGHSHLRAMAALDQVDRVKVCSRRPERARAFAEALSQSVPFPIEPVESVERALEGADIVNTTTNSSSPVLEYGWIEPGTHVNAVGSSIPTARELDSETVVQASLFVDRRESTLNESGDFLFAAKERSLGPDHIKAELGEILTGAHPGRTSEDEVTLFKSLGIAVEDLASAQFLYDRALESGVGTRVDF